MINNVVLLGNLTGDPEIRTTTSGKELCRFTLALNDKTASGEKKVEFVNCVAWENLGRVISKYFRKGDCISVVGSLRMSRYKTTHGDWATACNVDVSTFSFCGHSYDSDKESLNTDEPVVTLPGTDDDLPF